MRRLFVAVAMLALSGCSDTYIARTNECLTPDDLRNGPWSGIKNEYFYLAVEQREKMITIQAREGQSKYLWRVGASDLAKRLCFVNSNGRYRDAELFSVFDKGCLALFECVTR